MIWNKYCRNPVALVILPWSPEPGVTGVTIAKRDRDGNLYGCRDVSHGEHFADCVAAWKSDATGQGLVIEDAALSYRSADL